MDQRIVLVTGATGGLGRAVVRRFEEAGDLVAPVSRSAGEFAADLTDPGQAAAVVDRIAGRFGRIDAAVLAAGAFASGGTVEETEQEIWNRMLRLNFFSALYVCSSVLPGMKRAGSGRIVAVGSRAGVQLAAGLSAYGVSKSALHALIQTLGLELKDSGVTANAVLPSTIRTITPTASVRRSATTMGAVRATGTPWVFHNTALLNTSPTLPGVTVNTKPDRNTSKLSTIPTPAMPSRRR
jgi:NAD(P)-dependent dehydrogenase (short-subunit alcohol dehydrogenase family)